MPSTKPQTSEENTHLLSDSLSDPLLNNSQASNSQNVMRRSSYPFTSSTLNTEAPSHHQGLSRQDTDDSKKRFSHQNTTLAFTEPIMDLDLGSDSDVDVDLDSDAEQNPETKVIVHREEILDNEPFLIVMMKAVPKPTPRVFCLVNGDKKAILLGKNPWLYAVLEGFGLRYSVDQISKLYPNFRQAAGPYFTILEFGGALIGTYIATKEILHPNQPNSFAIRIWKAFTTALVGFIFTMGDTINTYEVLYPNTEDLSNQSFWGGWIALIPLTLFTLHFSWNSLSLSFRQRIPAVMRKSIDGFLEFLYISRIFQIFSINFFKMPNELIYELGPATPALLMALAEKLTSHEAVIQTFLRYVSAVNLNYMFAGDYLSTQQDGIQPPIVYYSRPVFWGSVFVGSNIFVIHQAKPFVTKYISESVEKSEFVAETVTTIEETYMEGEPLRVVSLNDVDSNSIPNQMQQINNDALLARLEDVERKWTNSLTTENTDLVRQVNQSSIMQYQYKLHQNEEEVVQSKNSGCVSRCWKRLFG